MSFQCSRRNNLSNNSNNNYDPENNSVVAKSSSPSSLVESVNEIENSIRLSCKLDERFETLEFMSLNILSTKAMTKKMLSRLFSCKCY